MGHVALILSVAFVILRFFDVLPEGIAQDSFKAFAHIFVGGLFAAGFVYHSFKDLINAEFYLGLAIALSVAELIAFLSDRFMPM